MLRLFLMILFPFLWKKRIYARQYVDERKALDKAEISLFVLRWIVLFMVTIAVILWWVLTRIPPENLSGESRLAALTRMFLG